VEGAYLCRRGRFFVLVSFFRRGGGIPCLLFCFFLGGGGAFAKTFKRSIVIVVSIDCKVSTLLQTDADATQLLAAASCQSPHNTAKPLLNWWCPNSTMDYVWVTSDTLYILPCSPSPYCTTGWRSSIFFIQKSIPQKSISHYPAR